MKARVGRRGLLLFTLYLSVCPPAVGQATASGERKPVFFDPGAHTLHLSKEAPVDNVALGPPGAGIELAGVVALSFQIKGEAGGEFLAFELASDADPPAQVALGDIYKYVATGVGTDWKTVVARISSRVTAVLSRASSLRVRLEEGRKATVSVRALALLPRREGTEGWDTLAISPQDFGLPDLSGISTIVLDDYEGVGTHLAELSPERQAGEVVIEPAPSPAAPAETPRDYSLVATFDAARPVGPLGHFGTFQRAPSSVTVELDDHAPRGGDAALRLDFHKRTEGFCGLWLRLGESTTPTRPRSYLDASRFRYLTFWIKGETGNEDVTVQLADADWERKEDSLPLGALSEFLPEGITGKWQEVAIQLDPKRYPSLDFARLASIAFNFRRPGKGSLFIDDVAFKVSRRTRLPESPPPPPPKDMKALPQATWVWETEKVLGDPQAREELFQFAAWRGIKLLFLQIGCRYTFLNGEVICQLEKELQLREFIRAARGRGLEVHALDGYAYNVLPAWQPRVLAQVRAVIDFNNRAAAEERFAGIHHDNEPYLLSAFAGTLGDTLLAHLLDLAAACQLLLRQAPARMAYGVDIPFWFSSRSLTWGGQRKPVSHHLLDIVDLVAVMAYRTSAYDTNGAVTLAADTVAYAGGTRKKVFVALETTPLPLQLSYTFARGASNDKPGGCYLLVEDWPGAAVLYWKDFDSAANGEPAPLPAALPAGLPRERVFGCVRKVVVPSARLSFAESSLDGLEAVVERLTTAFAGQAGFAGVAIHDYEGYRKLVERLEPSR